MELILWRHAEAEEGSHDLSRRLTDKGHQQAKRVGTWLKTHLDTPAQVWASEAERSRQTARYLSKNLMNVPAINPDASAASIAALLQRTEIEGPLVLVGHQPWIGELCAWLLSGSLKAGNGFSVKKAGAWWFEVDFHHDSPSAKLKAMITAQTA